MVITNTAFRLTRGAQPVVLASVRIPLATAQQLHPNVIRVQLGTVAVQLRDANREAANGISATVLMRLTCRKRRGEAHSSKRASSPSPYG